MTGRGEHLSKVQARRCVHDLLDAGQPVVVTKHVLVRMAERDVSMPDVLSTLRGGVYEEAEWDPERNTWKHRVWTRRFEVEIAIESEDEVLLVTAWRNP